jgi:hypothetical protein
MVKPTRQARRKRSEDLKLAIVLSLLTVIPCKGQTPTTGVAETTGPCSPVVTGNNNQFKITCEGIGEAQGRELLKIVNRISKEKLDPKLVMEKLDEIQKGVLDIKTGLAQKEQQEAEAERIRHTAPIIVVSLASVPEHGKIMVRFESVNHIPFEYRYVLTTENNRIVSGIPFAFSKAFPKSAPGGVLFYSIDPIQFDQIKNNYLEIRLTYQSLSYEELRLPGHSATIIRKYKIGSDDSLTELDNGQAEIIPHP